MADWTSVDGKPGHHNSGIDMRAYPDGVYLSGWYDSMVGIEGAFLSWEYLDALKHRAKRRQPYQEKEGQT